jgi:polysaccharide transporter, PST family
MTPDESASEATLTQAASGYRATIVSHVIRLLCKFTGVVVLARLVSPADHGLFAMAATLTFLLTLFRDFGMGAAAVQVRDLSEGQKTALWRLHAGLGALLAAMTLVLAPAVAVFYHEPGVATLLAWMSPGFLLNGLNSWPRTLLSRELHFREMNRVETAGAIAGTIAMITGGMMGAGAYSFVGFLLASEAVMLIVAWRLSPWRARAPADWRRLKPLASTGLHLTAYNVLLYGLQQADTLLMGRWFGAGPLGLYNRAGQLLMQPMTHLAAPFSHVLMATLARLGRDSPFFLRQFREATNAIAHFTLPAAVVCMVLPHEVVRLVLGVNWPDAAPLLAWLAVSAATLFLSATTYPLCVATGNAARLAQLTALALPITLACLWAGRAHGPVGIAAGLAVANACLLLPRLWWSSRQTPVRLRDFAAAFAGPLTVAAGLAGGLALGRLYALEHSVGARLGAATIAGAAAVGACALCWPRIRREFRSVSAHLPLPFAVTAGAAATTGPRPK